MTESDPTFPEVVDTIEVAQRVVGQIRQVADMDWTAHELEDALREGVLRAVAASSHPLAEVARLALSTSDIQFCRWYA